MVRVVVEVDGNPIYQSGRSLRETQGLVRDLYGLIFLDMMMIAVLTICHCIGLGSPTTTPFCNPYTNARPGLSMSRVEHPARLPSTCRHSKRSQNQQKPPIIQAPYPSLHPRPPPMPIWVSKSRIERPVSGEISPRPPACGDTLHSEQHSSPNSKSIGCISTWRQKEREANRRRRRER
jgi:hypothetical protein